MQFLGKDVHPVFFKQREHGDIDGGDGRRKPHDRVQFAVLFEFGVSMVDHVPDDAVDTKSRFNHVGYVPLTGFLHRFLVRLDVLLKDGFGRSVRKRNVNGKAGVFRQFLNGDLDHAGFGFERRPSRCTVDGPSIDDGGTRFLKFPSRSKGAAGCFLVTFQILAATVGDANAFHPTVASIDFSIPTIHGVVCHFVGFVLAES